MKIKESITNIIFDRIIREASLREGASLSFYLGCTNAKNMSIIDQPFKKNEKKEIYRLSIRRY